jgi:hypothetical protein
MINYDDFLNGSVTLEDTQPKSYSDELMTAFYASLDPVLGAMILLNLYTAYQMDKNGKNKYNWLIVSNVLNIYLFNLVAIRH